MFPLLCPGTTVSSFHQTQKSRPVLCVWSLQPPDPGLLELQSLTPSSHPHR